MKKLITIFAILVSTSAYGQSVEEFLKSGIDKHNKNDFKAAIIDYTKVIELDKENKYAYFNRGNCEFALNNYEASIKDLNKTIEIDPKFAEAYYNRANVFVKMEKYTEALTNLDKAIEIAPTTPNALSLRGQIRAQSGNKTGACEDFMTAKNNGDKLATKYLTIFCGDIKGYSESLLLVLPESEDWKIGDDQENAEQHVIDFVHKNETVDKWTELCNMTKVKIATSVPITVPMNYLYEQAKKNAPEAKLTLIEKDENAEFPWIIFTIESPKFNNDDTPESQLWYVVLGKQALYNNFRAIKEATIPNELKEKWAAFFKTAKVVYK
ncbi:MAG: tetratricopeptide repeat protein [Ignavibacteriae bacterium]|nr:tetratricopeptide repeat protein [Ignavibacteriota bacterium]